MKYSQRNFPNLHAGNYRETGRADRKYNCIAWAAGNTNAVWDPVDGDEPGVKYYWPPSVPRDYKIASLILAFESVGFKVCAADALEDGIEKIAIYADGDEYMHAARQLENGKWTSKVGRNEEIEHDTLDALAGPAYGTPTAFMKRNRPPVPTATARP